MLRLPRIRIIVYQLSLHQTIACNLSCFHVSLTAMTCNFLRLLQSKTVREIEIVIRQVAVTTMEKVVEKSREL